MATATTRKATQSSRARPAARAFKSIALLILVVLSASPALAQRRGGASARAEARRALADPCQAQLRNSSVRVQPALQAECLAKTYEQRFETATAVADQMRTLRKLALQRDIATNPGYSRRTKRILKNQLATDLSRFTRQNGDACDATRNSDLDPHIPDDPDACDPLDPDDTVFFETPLRLFEIRVPPAKNIYLGSGVVHNAAFHVQDCSSLPHHTFQGQGVFEHRPPSPGPCRLPTPWDIPGSFVELAFELRPSPASSISSADLQAYASSDPDFQLSEPKFLRVSLSGEELTRGGLGGNKQWWMDPGLFLARLHDCDASLAVSPKCLVISIGAETWYPGTHPWPNWKITVDLVDQIHWPGDPLDPGLIPQTFNIVRHSIAYSIVPPEEVKSFWTATIGKSVLHSNCTTCHTMDTPEKISTQHTNGYGGTAFWDTVGGFMAPSVLVDGQQVHHCSNCHENFEWHHPGFAPPGMAPFTESRWATPTQAQDINWLEIIDDNPTTWPNEICNRMTSTLNTPELREHHFHGDSRLFWAVEKGDLPQGMGNLAGQAPPGNFSQFVGAADIWNDWGAPCPD